MANGSRHAIYSVRETTAGVTPATPAMSALRITSTDLGLSTDALTSDERTADRQVRVHRQGAYKVEGSINFELSFGGTVDEVLESVLCGTWSGNVLKAGIERYPHSIERQFQDLAAGNRYFQMTGVEYNTLQLQMSANAMVTGSIGVLGIAHTDSATPIAGATYGVPTTTEVMDAFTGALLMDGSPYGNVTEIQLNLDNQMQARYVVGSKYSIQPSIGRSVLTGTLNAYFEDSTVIGKYFTETPFAIQVDLLDPAGNKYEVLLPKCKLTGAKPDVNDDGPIMLQCPFAAVYDETEQSNIVITRVAA